MTQAPKHWIWTRLDELGAVSGGVTKNAGRAAQAHRVPYLRVANVYANRLELEEVEEIDASEADLKRTLLEKGDLLVVEGNGSIDQIGRVALWNGAIEPCIHQNHIIKVRFTIPDVGPFTLYWLLSPDGRQEVVRVASSTSGLHTLSLSKVGSLPACLAPPGEQQRITTTLDSYTSRLDEATTLLERVQRNLKRYQASVLKAAVEGRLVPTEAELARAEKRDYEPASVLLQRILVERRQRWEAEGRRGKYEEPEPPDTKSLPELPEGWCWATVDQVAADMCDGPFGSNLKTEHYTQDGPRVIRLQNIGDGRFIDAEAHISDEHFSRLSKHRVEAGDVVIASLGDVLPRACVVPQWLGPAIVKADCLRLSPVSMVVSGYLALALNAYPTRKRTTDAIHGLGRPRIGLTLMRRVAVPLPPEREQERIAEEVDRRWSLAEEGETNAQHQQIKVSRLRQSILKWAFEGKLVDQDPNDEPASALLARIEAEQTATAPKAARAVRARTRGKAPAT